MNTKKDQALVKAHEDGYRVVDKKVISPYSGEAIRLTTVRGYPKFAHRIGKPGARPIVMVHRLVAYQKYGNKLFEEGIQVRHLDGDKLNFSEDNICIGTASENAMDMPREQRVARARKGVLAGSKARRRWSDEEILAIRKRHEETSSYSVVMKEFGITSKGSLHYIINNVYEAR